MHPLTLLLALNVNKIRHRKSWGHMFFDFLGVFFARDQCFYFTFKLIIFWSVLAKHEKGRMLKKLKLKNLNYIKRKLIMKRKFKKVKKFYS